MKVKKTFKEEDTECLTVKNIEELWNKKKRTPGKKLNRYPYSNAKPGFKTTITRLVNRLTEGHYISKKGDRPALYYMDENQRMMCKLTMYPSWEEDETIIESDNDEQTIPDLK